VATQGVVKTPMVKMLVEIISLQQVQTFGVVESAVVWAVDLALALAVHNLPPMTRLLFRRLAIH
jgi:hypothetical protein